MSSNFFPNTKSEYVIEISGFDECKIKSIIHAEHYFNLLAFTFGNTPLNIEYKFYFDIIVVISVKFKLRYSAEMNAFVYFIYSGYEMFEFKSTR